MPLVAAAAGICAAAAFGLYLLFGVAVAAWDDHPALVRDLAVVTVGLLVIASLGVRHAGGRGRVDDVDEGGDDHGGGGGTRRPPGDGPSGPPPGEPVHPEPAWGEFDALRAEWGRTPAGRT